DLGWVLGVILAFPAAMFVMSGAFGLWRAGIISKRFFSVGVVAVEVVPIGGTPRARNGIGAPQGAHASSASLQAILAVRVVSGVLVMRYSASREPERAAVPAA